MFSDAVSALANRLDRTEQDFVTHLQRVEDRLDQLVDLTKTVAVLQQQSTTQTDQIVEMRAQFREAQQKTDNSISRIHTRLDEIVNHQRDKQELMVKEVDMKIGEIRTQSSNTDKEFKQWLNRGLGAFAFASLIFGGIQTVAWRWMDTLDKDREATAKQIQTIVSTIDKHTQSLVLLERSIGEGRDSVRRVEQMQLDTDRQLEIIRNQQKR